MVYFKTTQPKQHFPSLIYFFLAFVGGGERGRGRGERGEGEVRGRGERGGVRGERVRRGKGERERGY